LSFGFFIRALTGKDDSLASATDGFTFVALGLRISRVLRFCDLAMTIFPISIQAGRSAGVAPHGERNEADRDGQRYPEPEAYSARSILIQLLAIAIKVLGHSGRPIGTVPKYSPAHRTLMSRTW
jgi:hypothetical protein